MKNSERQELIEQAQELIIEAAQLLDQAVKGTSNEANFNAYGKYGINQLLGNGNPYDNSLDTLLEAFEEEEADETIEYYNETLVGKRGEDYYGHAGKIVAVSTFEEWRKIAEYDGSGWLHDGCEAEFDLTNKSLIVAFERDMDGIIEVFTFGNGGVDLI